MCVCVQLVFFCASIIAPSIIYRQEKQDFQSSTTANELSVKSYAQLGDTLFPATLIHQNPPPPAQPPSGEPGGSRGRDK